MKIRKSLTDETILVEIGRRIASRRLEFQLTQAALAEEAGISKRTLEHLETGANVQLTTLIRVARVLGLLSNIDQLLPESKPRPIDVMTGRNRPRRRVATRGPAVQVKPWTWADEE